MFDLTTIQAMNNRATYLYGKQIFEKGLNANGEARIRNAIQPDQVRATYEACLDVVVSTGIHPIDLLDHMVKK